MYSDSLGMRVIRDTIAETPPQAAERIDRFTRSIVPILGESRWQAPLGPAWEGPPQVLTSAVASMPFINVLEKADTRFGGVFSIITDTPVTRLRLMVLFGSPILGRRHPLVQTSLELSSELMLDADVVEPLFAALIESWDPLAGVITGDGAEFSSGRGGWQIPVGYQTWIRDDVGPITQFTPGITSERLAGGTLLKGLPPNEEAHDIWKDIAATLALNGLDVLPRNARTAR